MAVSESAFRSMNEADLRKKILIPLLGKMGYEDAFEWHGQGGEIGKDVVAWKPDDLGNRRNIAIVAKAGRISGASAVGEVCTQVAQSFSSGYSDQISGEHRRVHLCWIVTNKRLGKEARAGIRAALPREHEPYVSILDGDDVWNRWRKHFPSNVSDAVKMAQEFFEQEDLPYRTRVWFEKGQRGVELGESYPGQLAAEPIEVSGEFRFPDTPEGREKLAEWRRGLATGDPVLLTDEFATLNLPDPIRALHERLLGEYFDGPSTIEITSLPPDVCTVLAFEFEDEEGDVTTLPWVEMRPVKIGTEQATLTNERQELPLLVTLVMQFDAPVFSVSIGTQVDRLAAPHFHQLLLIRDKLSKPGHIQVTKVDPGLPFGSARHGGNADMEVHPLFLDGIGALANLQWILKTPIYVPTGEIHKEDWKSIGLIHAALAEPNRTSSWSEASSQCRAADLPELIEHYASDEPHLLVYEEDAKVALFGEELNLGVVRSICLDARLVNVDDARRQAETAGPEDKITLQFRPGVSDESRMLFMTLYESMGGTYVNKVGDAE